MHTTFRITIAAIICMWLIASCANPEQEEIGLPNPASVNCEEKGGTLVIQKRGDGGEYGVCYFDDNRQCEEWAMYRGDCPEGGIKVTGYITDAAVYCAISGGEYTITDKSGSDDEQGTCSLESVTCDVWEFYNGVCDLNQ